MPKSNKGIRNGSSKRNPNTSSQQVVHRPPVVRYTPNVFGFPDRLMTKMRYAQVYNLPSTVGSLAIQSFRWNSTFDPDLAGVGHQPLYRDTYASIYDHYAVIKSSFKARFDNNTANPYLCGVVTDDDVTISSTYSTLMEQSHGNHTSLTQLTGSHSSHSFAAKWDCATYLNIDPFSDSTYKTAVGSNPAEESICAFWSIPFDGISTATLQLTVIFEYDVLWSELSTPTQS